MRIDSDGCALASFECAVADGNKLYFADLFGNDIFCYDMEANEVTLICTISEEDEYGSRLFSSMVIYEGDIFIFPFLAVGIYRINIQTGDYIVLDLPGGNMKEDKVAKFIDACIYNNVIYVMPATFPGILEVQCNSNKITVYDAWIEKIPTEFLDSDLAFLRKTLFIDSRIYAPLCKGNIIMIFDLKEKACIVKEVGTKKCRFSGICFDKVNFWLSPRDSGPIVKWNENKNIWQEYYEFPKDYVAGSSTGIEIWENQVMVFPQMANMLLVIDCADGTVKEWNKECRGENVLWYGKLGDSLLLCMGRSADVLVIKKNNVKTVNFFLPKSFQEHFGKIMSVTYKKLKRGMEKGDILPEAYSEALKDYLQYMLQNEEAKVEIDSKARIGQQIYRQIIS